MSKLVFISFSRHLGKHPWQLGLAVLGIMVGVAVIVAIRLTQASAFDAFDQATRTTTGSASHRIVGSQGWIGHDSLHKIAQAFPDIALTPVITRTLALPQHPNRSVVMLGIDPISRAQTTADGKKEIVLFDARELITTPGAAALNETTANALGLEKGSELEIRVGSLVSQLTVVAVLPGAARPGGVINDLLVVDIATAQEILSFFDGVDHVNIHAGDSRAIGRLGAMLEENLIADLELVDLIAQSSSIKRMTAAFYSNLTALSLMALLVGMFLIYNTETFLVLQRRQLLGRLRALGVSRNQILTAILSEAAVFGVIGSACGIGFGIALANGLLGVVSTTINDLYFRTSIESLSIDVPTLVASLLIGITATILAALVPAFDAMRMEPNLVVSRSSIRQSRVRQICLVTSVIFLLSNAAAWMVLSNSQTPNAGFAGICLIVIGFAALCPITIIALSWSASALIGHARLLPERLGFKTVRTTLNRTGTATAALMIATAASIGIGIMVTSFRGSVSSWLDSSLRADIYIADGQFDNHFKDRKIPQSIVAKLAGLSEVAATSNVVRRKVASLDQRIVVSGFNLNPIAKQSFHFNAGDPKTIWQDWETDDIVIVSEPFAYHHEISLHSEIPLDTASGERLFRVIGIYRDYASESGTISLSRSTYDRHWHTTGYDGLGIYAQPGVSADQLIKEIARALGDKTSLVVKSTKELKKTSLEIFDRTFLITDLLRAIAVTVSFIGVLGALLAQQLERTQEYGILRALGFSSSEISRTVLTQTTLLGATAALIAIPVGLLIGVVLIDVVNPRSFGWTMTLEIPALLIFNSCAIAIVAAFLAGLYPSYRAARIEPADAMRYE
ncbi:MAG: putative ABC transport system permease protein [Gammaproteobacteria bacterium]|jgi:putative ABC transport system permease protein